MNGIGTALLAVQTICAVILVGLFFLSRKGQASPVSEKSFQCQKEAKELSQMRKIALTKPLAEQIRPTRMQQIIGQEEGIRALRAALCGEHPQHVLLYGPPGVGKTAAVRLILEEAKREERSPFQAEAKMVEVDATTLRYDERSIADPLLGSVHDPIYQGAGAYGTMGIPKPRMGAVSKAHGGILFLDEIGELPSSQLNKLLKVLEDRKVMLQSAYYEPSDAQIPAYIHDIFQNGLPADFRLVGATTRRPEEIPMALRSRCTEIFFRPLNRQQTEQIARTAAKALNVVLTEEGVKRTGDFSQNGRDAANLVQTAAAAAALVHRNSIGAEEISWVAQMGKYTPRFEQTLCSKQEIGKVNGLGVAGYQGMVLQVECWVKDGPGGIQVTGIVAEEELETGRGRLRRSSTAADAVQTAAAVLQRQFYLNLTGKEIYLHFTGGLPVDGPSAGLAICAAMYSALLGCPVRQDVALTGEVDLEGRVLPVGGMAEKLEAAFEAGAKEVFVPRAGFDPIWQEDGKCIHTVDTVKEAFQWLWAKREQPIPP